MVDVFNGSVMRPTATTSTFPFRAPAAAGSCHRTSRCAQAEVTPTIETMITTIMATRMSAPCRMNVIPRFDRMTPTAKPPVAMHTGISQPGAHDAPSPDHSANGCSPLMRMANNASAARIAVHNTRAAGSSLQSRLPRSRPISASAPPIVTPSPSRGSSPRSSHRSPTPRAAGRRWRNRPCEHGSRGSSARSPVRCR